MRGSRVKQLRIQLKEEMADVIKVTGIVPKRVWRRYKKDYNLGLCGIRS